VIAQTATGGPLRGGHQAAPTTFAQAMSVVASSVAVVTCRLSGRPWGMTVTAFASVSADPPTLLVSLASASAAARAITRSHAFGISMLAADQVAVAAYGSAPKAPKFLEPFAALDDGLSLSPVVAGCLAHLDCELSEQVPFADHTVFFGRVRAARANGDSTPLIYHRRGYGRLAATVRTPTPTERNLTCLSS
jgi:flavin reductase (DIM6/NTAB) family NADH-FMN oxidoreductase RutF